MALRFRCRTCDRDHVGLPVFGPDAPDAYADSSAAERAGAVLTADRCELGDRRFLRARINIPVHGHDDEPFGWLVWVDLAREHYERAVDRWNATGREHDAEVEGRLAVRLPFYPATNGLAVRMRTMPVGRRPEVRVVDDHPLRREQVVGISEQRAIRRAEALLHPDHESTIQALQSAIRALHERLGPEDSGIRFDGRDADHVPPVALLDVWVWRAQPREGLKTFATIGMSRGPMPGSALHAELQMTVAGASSADEHAIAAFLANLSCYPWQIGASLDHFHTVGNVGRIPCFPSCSAVLLREPLVGSTGDVETSAGPVRLLQVVPITQEERALGRHGIAAMRALFETHARDPFLDPGR